MKRRFLLAVAVTALLVLVGATFAFGGVRGLIWDDGHYAKPGSLDDGKELLSQTKITLPQAVAAAQKASRPSARRTESRRQERVLRRTPSQSDFHVSGGRTRSDPTVHVKRVSVSLVATSR
jgi:hypothetical protein